MRFEIGKVYTHSAGEMVMIVGEVETTLYGKTLVAESICVTHLKAFGDDEDATQNWSEVPLSVWWKHWLKGNEGSPDLQRKLAEALEAEERGPTTHPAGLPWGRVAG